MADMKISELPMASAADGTEQVPVVQGKVTRRASPAALLAGAVIPGTLAVRDPHNAPEGVVRNAEFTPTRDAARSAVERLTSLEARWTSPALRAPMPEDDAGEGYVVGDVWVTGDAAFVAQNVAPGAAVWVPQSVGTNPFAGRTDVLGLYGVVQLSPAYTGPCASVKRMNDGVTRDFGFVNGRIDPAVMKWLAGTYGAVRPYDQSGAGRHLTQNSDASCAYIYPGDGTYPAAMTGGLPSLLMPGAMQNTVADDASSSGASSFLEMPVSFAGDVQTFSAIGVVRSTTGTRQTGAFMLKSTGLITLAMGYAHKAAPYFTTDGSNSLPQHKCWLPSTPSVVALTTSPVKSRLLLDEVWVEGAGAPSQAFAGGQIASSGYPDTNAPHSGAQEWSAWAFFKATVSDTDMLKMRLWLAAACGLRPQLRDAVTVIGDSGIESGTAAFLQNIPRRLEAMLPPSRPAKFYVNAKWGEVASADDVAGTTSRSRQHFRGIRARAVGVVLKGSNDLGHNVGAATTYDVQSGIVARLRAGGAERVALFTIRPRSDFPAGSGQEDARQELNTLIRGNLGGIWGAAGRCDAVLDVATEPVVGDPVSNTANTAIYQDGLHLTRAGDSGMLQMLAPVVSGWLRE